MRITKKTREKTQITNIRNERVVITTDPIDIKGIINTHKFDTLDKMDQFLERHKLPKLTQGEIDNLKSPTSIKETESVINNLSKKGITNFRWVCL